ncbi:MAG: AAA family ATPase [Bacteroidota bacterium]
MNIKQITIGGFANIEEITLSLNKFNALIALNNYGKSNVINAISFGFDYISETIDEKSDMMALRPLIPINKFIESIPFKFEIVFTANLNEEDVIVTYGFCFEWIKNDGKGKKIKEEYLKVKLNRPDSKPKTYIKRNSIESFYLPSKTGRCDRFIKVKKSELLINKLQNYDHLFFHSLIEEINGLKSVNVDTLQNPDKLFRTISAEVVKTGYSLGMPDSSEVAYFIYSLMKNKPDLYEVFKDSVISLLKDIEDFEPIEIDFKSKLKFESEKEYKKKIPLDFPDKIYDIRVKEVNNNQQSDIVGLSSGSQKIFYVIALTIAAELNKVPLVFFEEIENSIHPGLLQQLLIIIDGITEDTKVVTSSHSPYLIQYLDTSKIKIGIPNDKGLAQFSEIKQSKFKKVIEMAEDEGISVGDLIFDRVIECSNGDRELLNELCF